MAKIEDWFVPPIDVRPFGGLAGFMLYVAAVYLRGPFWQEFSEYILRRPTTTIIVCIGNFKTMR